MPYKILWVPDIFLFDAADSISWNIWQTECNLYNRIQKKKMRSKSTLWAFFLILYFMISSRDQKKVSLNSEGK